MTERERLRAQYIEGWYQLDDEALVSAVAVDFVFDDPAEPILVTKEMLPAYMLRWDARMKQLGGDNEWLLTDEVREDKDGVLTDWETWEVLGTGMRGMAVVKTRDDGVFLERNNYVPVRGHSLL